jgi:anthranilate phosphoribosyltransferase
MSDITQDLKKLINHCNLNESESYALFQNFQEAPPAQQAAVLALLTSKGVTVPELNGALRYFLAQATTIEYSHPVIDIVGTGGDGLGTFNISTAASMVVASSGIKVAKHGGRASTSRSGSVDVIEHLGIPLYDDPKIITANLDKYHYAYLCGPLFNPLLKSLGPLRRSLGFQTLLNILSPMANPMRPSKLVIGVYQKDLVRKLAEVLLASNKEHAMIICSEEGLDELSVSAATHVAEVTANGITEYIVTPEEAGLPRSPLSEVIGGTPAENAQIIRGIFKGDIKGAKLDIVLLNAASGFVVAGEASDLAQGVILARDQIASGKALALLNNLNKGVHNE